MSFLNRFLGPTEDSTKAEETQPYMNMSLPDSDPDEVETPVSFVRSGAPSPEPSYDPEELCWAPKKQLEIHDYAGYEDVKDELVPGSKCKLPEKQLKISDCVGYEKFKDIPKKQTTLEVNRKLDFSEEVKVSPRDQTVNLNISVDRPISKLVIHFKE